MESFSCGALCRTRSICYPGDSFPQQRGEWKLFRCPPQSSTSIANADARRYKCWQAECLPSSLPLPQDTGINNSLTAVPVCCSRHTYQSRQSRGAFSLKSDRAMKQTRGSRGNIPIYMSVPNIKVCALLPKIHSACYLDLKFTWPRPSAAHTLLLHLPPRSALPSNSARN